MQPEWGMLFKNQLVMKSSESHTPRQLATKNSSKSLDSGGMAISWCELDAYSRWVGCGICSYWAGGGIGIHKNWFLGLVPWISLYQGPGSALHSLG